MGPFPASDRTAKFDFGAVFRFDGGKIAEWWVTWDNMTILRALGHLPNG
jgi:SnoaL-like polyketide cyclase